MGKGFLTHVNFGKYTSKNARMLIFVQLYVKSLLKKFGSLQNLINKNADVMMISELVPLYLQRGFSWKVMKHHTD